MATAYLILQQHEADVWTKRAEVEAVSAEQAVREYAKGGDWIIEGDGQAVFVAVPSRSFAPVKVAVETTRQIRIVGAGNAAPAHPPAPKDEAA